MLHYQPDWSRIRERFEAFWQGEVLDRCMLAVTVKTMPEQGDAANPRSWYHPSRTEDEIHDYWLSPEAVLRRNLQKLESTRYLGDAIPQVFFDLGAVAYAGFFHGVRYRYTDSIWFFPSLKYGELPVFNPDSTLYKAMLEIGVFLAKEGAGKFLVSMPDHAGILDCLAHLRGSENLLMDLMDDRDWVKACCAEIQKIWLKVVEEIYGILKPCNEGGSGIGWLNVWAPGKINQMQCDLSVMISQADFREMVVPELEACMAWMDHSLYHFDGVEQVRHLDALLGLDQLEAIQWTCVDGQPPPTQFTHELRRIQEAGKRLVILHSDADVIETLSRKLSSKGLLLVTSANSIQSAQALIEQVSRNTRP